MAGVISRHSVIHVRPWHLEDLNARAKAAPVVVTPEVSALAEPVVFPTVAELDALREKGYEEGFSSGRDEARSKLSREIKALEQGVERLSQQLAAVDGIYAQFFSDVCGEIADVLDTVPPAQLAKKVQQAMATISRPERLVLCMHPEDVACLREVAPDIIGSHELTINETDSLSRGGFVIRSPFGEVDATVESTLQKLKKALQNVPV